uniref:fibroblast growth factor 23-like n=1 Tax=Gasterosteus aculeatus aculeatus TaxID=481459 RepID=UPI001A985994|nr:fibroblast growth factor 23-like [Gasterosteus aculeatus aculeatus]
MQPAFFSLVLIAVHASLSVDCAPRLRGPTRLVRHQPRSFQTGAHADTSAGTSPFYWEPSGSTRKGLYRNSFVILPVRTATSNLVSIFDLRRKRFLCMDSTGDPYSSRQADADDCLFQPVWLDAADPHDVFNSISVGRRRFGPLGSELGVAYRQPPKLSSSSSPSSSLVERFLGPSVKRRRRSDAVNPSDPLRSHSHPSHSAQDHKDVDHRQPDQDQAGAVSKETITSCDDPLRVLQPNGPVSPVKTNIADRAEQE